MTTTLATEARAARMRYQDRGVGAGSSEASQQACWEEAVRPLVEEIERLRGEPTAHDLTPSERALAKILAALEDYQSDPKERSEIRRPLERLHDQVLWSGLNPRGFTGATRLARARKAGVL